MECRRCEAPSLHSLDRLLIEPFVERTHDAILHDGAIDTDRHLERYVAGEIFASMAFRVYSGFRGVRGTARVKPAAWPHFSARSSPPATSSAGISFRRRPRSSAQVFSKS